MTEDRKRRVAALEAVLPRGPQLPAPPLVVVHQFAGETQERAILHEFGPEGVPDPPPGCSPDVPSIVVFSVSVHPRPHGRQPATVGDGRDRED